MKKLKHFLKKCSNKPLALCISEQNYIGVLGFFVCLFIPLYDEALGSALQTENITLPYPRNEAEFGVVEFVKDKARSHVFVIQNHS